MKLSPLVLCFWVYLALSPGNVPVAETITASEERRRNAETLLQQLGYKRARVLEAWHPKFGHDSAIIVFKPRGKSLEQRKSEAVEVFRHIIDIVDSATLTLVTVKQGKRLRMEKLGDYDYLFWKAADGNWRLIKTDLQRYLKTSIADTDPVPTPAELAYLYWSLAVIEGVGANPEPAAEHFESAISLIEEVEDDPWMLRIRALQGLIRIYAKSGDEDDLKGTLRRYAFALGESQIRLADYRPVYKTAPAYPRRAFSRGIQGEVTVEFTVTEDGTVENIVVVEERPAGEEFGIAAKEAAKDFLYVPRVVNGELVATDRVRNKVSFNIER